MDANVEVESATAITMERRGTRISGTSLSTTTEELVLFFKEEQEV